MMKLLSLVLLAICACAAFAQGPGGLKNGERPFSSENIKVIAGMNMGGYELKEYSNATISVKSTPYDGFVRVRNNSWSTLDIRGWDKFVSLVGIDDNQVGTSATLTVEVDGNMVSRVTVRHGDKPVLLEIPLTNCSALTLRWSAEMMLITPRMVKGDPTPLFTCQHCGGTFPSQKALADHISTAHRTTAGSTPPNFSTIAATFVVDPNDLDKLSANLRKRVDAKPEVQQNLGAGFMAVMTFNLIDIASPSVAQNVAEDLSTRLINADFNLVERGQLDKALKELRIENSGMIDQATAQKLGQLTGCNFILVGSVSDRGQFIVMNARILETATGKAVAAESVECRKIEIKR